MIDFQRGSGHGLAIFGDMIYSIFESTSKSLLKYRVAYNLNGVFVK